MAASSATSLMAAVAGEFLEAAIPTILYIRGVYPAELFERKRKYNVPVRQSRHKDLNEYIAGAIKDMMEWMSKGIVERVVLSIEEAASGRQLERFVFEFELDLTADRAAHARSLAAQARESLEDAFRQVLLKINVADSLLAPLPKELTFGLYAHTASRLHDNDDWEEMASEGNDRGRAEKGNENMLTVPLKSVQAGCFRLQLLVQSPSSG
ncbi:hypothetical protein GUITHDRAFT_150603 [Guillardia theta CCMP2712]|uniref:HORMA domain-containing protein n=1 Tax=Guillardia theta (strain CCMP2712) TaxID=905079 RepID=L1JWP4_GUITC|nr:hypothetical protein GUITHDRAFT_150603 [Guillardia theta CCMP2712]EKX52630.1 hypothetical protein GUITHDRAFT_150603 [Guillardia theta CCMP2712]|eukprot:XP_005839610.1 hypothetical protein GUITHDRAFT_150603 [Guillardia theta CCMP2712]